MEQYRTVDWLDSAATRCSDDTPADWGSADLLGHSDFAERIPAALAGFEECDWRRTD